MEITFEQLPKAVTQLCEDMAFVKKHLLEKSNQPQPEIDEIFTVPETAKFLGISVPTVYGLNHKGELPSMKRSKRLYFSKLDLINYLKAGRKKTFAEISVEASNRIGHTKKGLQDGK